MGPFERVVFEGAIPHEFGVKPAIRGVIDVLEKQSIQMGTQRNTRLVAFDADRAAPLDQRRQRGQS
jgi:hypothetical protein